MKPEEFCYWLQGVFEMSNTKEFDKRQTATLKRHLGMVFEHIAHLDEKDQPKVNMNPLSGYDDINVSSGRE